LCVLSFHSVGIFLHMNYLFPVTILGPEVQRALSCAKIMVQFYFGKYTYIAHARDFNSKNSLSSSGVL
jgi:hypothetical protein